MASEDKLNLNRLLVCLLGGVVSVASVLGNHALHENENAITKNEIAVENLRNLFDREIGPVKDQLSRIGIRLDTLEESAKASFIYSEKRNEKLADFGSDLKLLQQGATSLSERISRLEGAAGEVRSEKKR